jgi:hypothetical protein
MRDMRLAHLKQISALSAQHRVLEACCPVADRGVHVEIHKGQMRALVEVLEREEVGLLNEARRVLGLANNGQAVVDPSSGSVKVGPDGYAYGPGPAQQQYHQPQYHQQQYQQQTEERVYQPVQVQAQNVAGSATAGHGYLVQRYEAQMRHFDVNISRGGGGVGVQHEDDELTPDDEFEVNV